MLPGASVTVVNKATNATRTTVTNSAGLFDFPGLPPGAYSVTAELEGFRTGVRDLELRVQQVLRVNFALELATIQESATVVGVSPLVETSNATVGTVIENRRIVELPLNGRNYLQLVALSPNVSADFAGPGQAGDRQGGSRANQQLSISGQRREFNNYTLDGVDNTDVNFNTYIFLPSVDALEEFKVQTGVYSAEFGRAASQVNVVTKAGTNAFNGTLFWFHRDDAWDAKPYSFTPSQYTAPMAPFKWDQYGYTATGPVMRNRIFFMSNFEGYRDRKQFQTLYSVPSSAMRNGNFSELLSNLGPVNPQTGQPAGILVDPTQCTVVGTSRSCAPFPGNIIPAARLHPTSTQLLEFYPEPNNGASGLANNYLALQDRTIDKYQYTQRMDFVQGATSTWMGRYSYAKDNEVTPALKLNGTKLDARVHQAMVGNTWSLTTHAPQRIPLRLQLLLQHVRTGAGLRARRGQGARHPGHLAESSRGLGHPLDRHYGVQRLRRQHRRAIHDRQPHLRVQQQPVVDQGAARVQGRAPASATTCTTRWATSSPAATSSSRTSPAATGSAISCWAMRSRPNPRWRWR